MAEQVLLALAFLDDHFPYFIQEHGVLLSRLSISAKLVVEGRKLTEELRDVRRIALVDSLRAVLHEMVKYEREDTLKAVGIVHNLTVLLNYLLNYPGEAVTDTPKPPARGPVEQASLDVLDALVQLLHRRFAALRKYILPQLEALERAFEVAFEKGDYYPISESALALSERLANCPEGYVRGCFDYPTILHIIASLKSCGLILREAHKERTAAQVSILEEKLTVLLAEKASNEKERNELYEVYVATLDSIKDTQRSIANLTRRHGVY